jgi:hypothetical protein
MAINLIEPVSLIMNPGPDQRALAVVSSKRQDRMGLMVEKARTKYGAVTLVWLYHDTEEMVRV